MMVGLRDLSEASALRTCLPLRLVHSPRALATGYEVASAEHAFNALKAVDPGQQRYVLEAPTPGEQAPRPLGRAAARLGRRRAGLGDAAGPHCEVHSPCSLRAAG